MKQTGNRAMLIAALMAGALGGALRRVQTGRIRTYVAALALTAAVLLGMLAVLTR